MRDRHTRGSSNNTLRRRFVQPISRWNRYRIGAESLTNKHQAELCYSR